MAGDPWAAADAEDDDDIMSRLSQLALNDEGFVFDPATGDSFQVSETGLVILKALREGRSDEEIGRALSEKYEVEAVDALRDVADFRSSLKTFGWL